MDFDVLLANGKIVPRKHFDLIKVVPFGWKPKRDYPASLSTPDPNPILSPFSDFEESSSATYPLSSPSLHSSIFSQSDSDVGPFVSSSPIEQQPLLLYKDLNETVGSTEISPPTTPPRLIKNDAGHIVLHSPSSPVSQPTSSPLSPSDAPLPVTLASPPVLRRSGCPFSSHVGCFSYDSSHSHSKSYIRSCCIYSSFRSCFHRRIRSSFFCLFSY